MSGGKLTVFGFGIPALWSYSNAYAFVIDSGYGCDEAKEKLEKYIDAEMVDVTGVCIDGKMYYLGRVDGKSTECKCEITGDHGPCQTTCWDKKFTAPLGVEELNGEQCGGIKLEDLVKGSVNTYNQNGGRNGGAALNVDGDGAFDALLNVNVTTLGMVRLSVCSPERAFQAWGAQDMGNKLYPCNDVPGKNDCGDLDFEDQTSDASPSVDDCCQIIKNIQGDSMTEWTT
ncbi:uncharacterized protein CC84DRAFT_1205124 [Paraphaeosphaeria sporulosa]|uniref:Ecp2 effector protein-like domain-containing protein n=1 Tax=Paraphaeosphaeria sporulosa TaxID=1460663 RepID=A0A177CLM1_9PLEO|nr:uncharacterized protein CC84DRAFT_1205124 [Paraphaeosphaeria sporulosa]OAG07719.1 hypothetical protein CC84DRAFT_1205124 [Paraphaeosphaeria sporulosa]